MKIELSDSEAVVLFEFLRRYSQSDILGIEDQAEQRVLWDIECIMEASGVCFDEDWPSALAKARDMIRDEGATNATLEKEQGRMALWLEPSQIRFLISEWRALPETFSAERMQSWGDIAFRCDASLHQAGIEP